MPAPTGSPAETIPGTMRSFLLAGMLAFLPAGLVAVAEGGRVWVGGTWMAFTPILCSAWARRR